MILKTDSLTPEQLQIIINKGTEQPFYGEYDNYQASGTYLCRQCGLALFRSAAKFSASCGWPSFDAQIAGNVITAQDGQRLEILCARCRGHLGHVFHGEGFTANNIRHCVNSLSLDFVADIHIVDSEEVIVAAGCFWGVEYYYKKLMGVVKTEVGYIGDNIANPSYTLVCSGQSHYVEAVRVVYDPSVITNKDILQYFFEIHDPTQTDGQGPDIGRQYLSCIFYYTQAQKELAENLIAQLQEKRYQVATQLLPISTFWRAEDYHQDYYQKTGKQPYCHRYTIRF